MTSTTWGVAVIANSLKKRKHVHSERKRNNFHRVQRWVRTQTLRQILSSQQRITTTLTRRDGRVVHVRKATRPEPDQQRINEILGLSANPGGTHCTVV